MKMNKVYRYLMTLAVVIMTAASLGAQKSPKVNMDLKVNSGQVISDKLMGFNIVYAKTPDSVWKNDVLVDGIRAVNPGFLRYPGGTVNTYFHFESPTGQGWKDNWDPAYDMKQNRDPSQYTDIDEYFKIIDRTGAEPLVGINTNSAFVYDRIEDGVAEALRLMQYCRDKGYNVKYWYLGNEPYAKDGNGGRVGPGLYAKMINTFAPRMKEFDPDIKIIANCKSDIIGDRASWDEFLSTAGKNVDMVDIHWYNMWGKATWDQWIKRTPHGTWTGISYEQEIENFKQICRDHNLPELPICTLEWNVGPGRKTNGSVLTVGQSALAQSEMMLQFMRGGVYMATFWPLFYEGEFCTRGFYDKASGKLNPISDVLATMSGFQRLSKIDFSVTGYDKNLIMLAACDSKSGECKVCVLNKNDRQVELSLSGELIGKRKKGQMEAYRMSEDLQILEYVPVHEERLSRISLAPYSLTFVYYDNPDIVEQRDGYKVVFGNTHAHCNFSGDIAKFRAKKGLGLDPANSVENHFRLAKENGYDFYCITDHSQYPCYTQEAWKLIGSAAKNYTDDTFVAIRGYEHSENDGPDGKGHMNVYASDTFLNALGDGVSIEYFHNWLANEANEGTFAGFNHPQKDAYNDFTCYNDKAYEKIRVIELINGSRPKFYNSYLNALSKGWKVSPVAGCDNHSYEGISKWGCRTGLLVTELTHEGVLDAMRERRTYASFDRNMEIRYTVNGSIMGSEISPSRTYEFVIDIADPDMDQNITRVEIVGGNGNVVAFKESSSNEFTWTTKIKGSEPYYYVLVYTSKVTDHPTAYVAPVWIKE